MARKIKTKKYSASRLAIILAMMLILEGVLMGVATSADWHQAIQVLDISTDVSQLPQQMTSFFQPIFDVATDVNQFYVAAAQQLRPLLDMSNSGFGSELGWIYVAVNDFYQQAATQMVAVLDLKGSTSWSATVAGISIQK